MSFAGVILIVLPVVVELNLGAGLVVELEDWIGEKIIHPEGLQGRTNPAKNEFTVDGDEPGDQSVVAAADSGASRNVLEVGDVAKEFGAVAAWIGGRNIENRAASGKREARGKGRVSIASGCDTRGADIGLDRRSQALRIGKELKKELSIRSTLQRPPDGSNSPKRVRGRYDRSTLPVVGVDAVETDSVTAITVNGIRKNAVASAAHAYTVAVKCDYIPSVGLRSAHGRVRADPYAHPVASIAERRYSVGGGANEVALHLRSIGVTQGMIPYLITQPNAVAGVAGNQVAGARGSAAHSDIARRYSDSISVADRPRPARIGSDVVTHYHGR